MQDPRDRRPARPALRRRIDAWGLLLPAAIALVVSCCATRPSGARPNLDLPTLGGVQLWADVAWSDGWRVQRHAWTGHHRLLDPEDVRRAWGSEAACVEAVDEREARHAEDHDHLVVLLHGLGRSRGSMDVLHAALEQDGYRVASLSYPSMRGTLDEHAEAIAGVLAALEGVDRVSFVTHSLGGRVVQRMLARDDAWRETIEVGRVVQIAPPNQGSALGRIAESLPVLPWLYGPVLPEVSEPDPEGVEAEVEFGVIAGIRGGDDGWNPLLVGEDDGVVSVEETRLAGPHRHLSVRGVHTYLMEDPLVVDATRRFLATGGFQL